MSEEWEIKNAEKQHHANRAVEAEALYIPKAGGSMSALQDQVERSIETAATAYKEARDLTLAYKKELRAACQTYHFGLKRTRRGSRIAWGGLAAAAIIIYASVWIVTRQAGSLEVQRLEAAHLDERIRQTNDNLTEAVSRAERLGARVEALNSEQSEMAGKLRLARLNRIDAAAQLAAFRSYTDQLTARLRTIEAEHSRKIREEKNRTTEVRRISAARVELMRAEVEQIRAALGAERIRAVREARRIRTIASRPPPVPQPVRQTANTRISGVRQINSARILNRNHDNMTLTELEQTLMRK